MYTDILILANLRSGPKHGYDIKKHVDRVLGGFVTLNNKMLYPALRRFEELGAVQREVERQDGKPDRHIYRITERGIEILQGRLQDFSPEIAHNEAEFFVRVAFFDRLEPEACMDILATRTHMIQQRLNHIQEMKMLSERGGPRPYPEQILQLYTQQLQLELAWLQSMTRDITPE